jgi:hypothetical protein
LTPEMGARLDDIMERKLKGSGLKLPRWLCLGSHLHMIIADVGSSKDVISMLWNRNCVSQ